MKKWVVYSRNWPHVSLFSIPPRYIIISLKEQKGQEGLACVVIINIYVNYTA